MPDSKKPITDVKVRMYKLGTGDCLSVKFFYKNEVTFKMLFDCGCFQGSKARLTPLIEELIEDLDNHVDVLVVTHEHQDHVLGFQRCEELFKEELTIGEVWMGWTEDDSRRKVRRWKKDYGQKKMALARAAKRINDEVNSAEFKNQLKGAADSAALLAFQQNFAASIQDFAALHANESEKEYKGPLKGMQVVKEELEHQGIAYMSSGEVYFDIEGLDGVRIFVLGPPNRIRQVEKESGEIGESYQHNKKLDPEDFKLNEMRSELEGSDYFVRTMNFDGNLANETSLVPFSRETVASKATAKRSVYEAPESAWRRIDNEWLQSSANLALRMNSLTNNLSLVLGIQFEESGKVMLFPGDAEFGSWESWHKIDWSESLPDEDITTEDLLNKTVFYKVAHHLSHNGTAQSIGLEMMDHPELVAMATLNYEVISNGWKTTMPNRAIMKALLERTKGRTIVQNTDELFFDLENEIPLTDKIDEYQQQMTDDERESYNNSIVDNQKFVEIEIKI
ncbi:hypothetical protein OAG68_00170 [bacterium]|nr:hypothetical protein [bacterium]